MSHMKTTSVGDLRRIADAKSESKRLDEYILHLSGVVAVLSGVDTLDHVPGYDDLLIAAVDRWRAWRATLLARQAEWDAEEASLKNAKAHGYVQGYEMPPRPT